MSLKLVNKKSVFTSNPTHINQIINKTKVITNDNIVY